MEELAGGAQQAEQLGAAAAQEVLPLVGGGETDGGGVPVIDGAGGDGGFGMPDGQGGASVVMTANQQLHKELRTLPLYRNMPTKENSTALRDARWDIMVRYRGAAEGCGWGRSTCAQCLERQQGYNRCRGKGNGYFGHSTPDADSFLWHVGGHISLMHDGHESLAGVITHFDYRSGYHTITSEDGTTTPLILSYNRKGLTYTPPIAADGDSAQPSVPVTYIAGRKVGKRKREKAAAAAATADGAAAGETGAAGAAAAAADPSYPPPMHMTTPAPELYAIGMAAGGVLAQPCHVCQSMYDVPLAKPFCVWCPNCHVSIWLPWALQQLVEQQQQTAAATAGGAVGPVTGNEGGGGDGLAAAGAVSVHQGGDGAVGGTELGVAATQDEHA